tara:strand:- start:472 stop:1059 length:588 start_codon:yes stop_codon:yes gene_type:complete
MAVKYFNVYKGDLPESWMDGHTTPLTFHNAKIWFAICGCEESDYDAVIEPLKASKPITDIVDEDTAITASRCWGDVREKRSLYQGDSDVDKYADGTSGKIKIEITDDMRSKTLTVMKQHAKMLVQKAIDDGEGDPYNSSLLTDIENSASVKQINIIYEDYLGDQLPRGQALELNLYESDGHTRKFAATRNKPSFL